MVIGLYHEKIYTNDVLNKMAHVYERFRILTRSKSFNKDQIQKIDYHITEIMKILNKCS